MPSNQQNRHPLAPSPSQTKAFLDAQLYYPAPPASMPFLGALEFASKYQLAAVSDVLAERGKQFQKWGEQSHDLPTWLAILSEEQGELAEAVLHEKFGGPEAANLFKEATHVAAVALQIVEFLLRRTEGQLAVAAAESVALDGEFEDMKDLVADFAGKVVGAELEVSFDEMFAACRELALFEWVIDLIPACGVPSHLLRPTNRCRRRLGLLWACKYQGRIFRLDDGRNVRFGCRGRLRHRRFTFSFAS